MEKTSTTRIKINEDIKVVYDAVAWYEDNLFPLHSQKLSQRPVEKRKRLRSIANIHNVDGIRDIKQIERMIKSMGDGKNALAESGMPNIKLYKTISKKLFLFHLLFCELEIFRIFLYKKTAT